METFLQTLTVLSMDRQGTMPPGLCECLGIVDLQSLSYWEGLVKSLTPTTTFPHPLLRSFPKGCSGSRDVNFTHTRAIRLSLPSTSWKIGRAAGESGRSGLGKLYTAGD